MARPTTPGHDSSAPSHTNATVATICQRMWNHASSFVSQPAKKLTLMSCHRRVGKKALSVNQAPIRLTIRNAQLHVMPRHSAR